MVFGRLPSDIRKPPVTAQQRFPAGRTQVAESKPGHFPSLFVIKNDCHASRNGVQTARARLRTGGNVLFMTFSATSVKDLMEFVAVALLFS